MGRSFQEMLVKAERILRRRRITEAAERIIANRVKPTRELHFVTVTQPEKPVPIAHPVAPQVVNQSVTINAESVVLRVEKLEMPPIEIPPIQIPPANITVNVPEFPKWPEMAAPQVTVENVVNVPEQPAPQITVSPEVKVEMPEAESPEPRKPISLTITTDASGNKRITEDV